MISPEEARDLAARRAAAAPGEINIVEFELGYVAIRLETWPPAAIGGGAMVVDKETGEITTWPNRGAEMVIEQYRQSKRAHPPLP